MSKLLQLLGCVTVVAAWTTFGYADDQNKTGNKVDQDKPATKIDGKYAVESGERDGKPMAKEDVQNCVVVITTDRITGSDKDGKEFLNAKYTTDDTKKDETGKRCHIIMTTADGKAYRGICEKTSDGLRIVYQLDGGEPPADFKTKEKQVMLVMKMAK